MSAELSIKLKTELNLLANMLLMMDGYQSCMSTESNNKLFDFSTSTMQRDQKAWNKAVTSYAFLNKEPEFLKHQVEITASLQIQFEQA